MYLSDTLCVCYTQIEDLHEKIIFGKRLHFLDHSIYKMMVNSAHLVKSTS